MKLRGFTLARKIACITAGIGLCMTLAFTVISFRQMREVSNHNFQTMLTGVLQSLKDRVHQDYARYTELADLVRSGGSVQQVKTLEKLWQELLEGMTLGIAGLRIIILNPEGQLLSPAALQGHPLPQTLAPKILQEAAATEQPFTLERNGQNYSCIVFSFAPRQWYVVSFIPHQMFEESMWSRSRAIVLTGLGITLFGLALALILGRKLTAPLSALDTTARTLSFLDVRSPEALNALPALPLTRNDEVGTLARSFDFMVRQMHDNVLQLLRMGEEQARMLGELRTARDIQDGMLPKVFPHLPNLAVHGLVIPAREVGGDFFDAFMLDDEHFCFAVGDVSDKGVPAALVMSMVLTLCRALPHERPTVNPADILERINTMLSLDNPRNMFVTMLFGIVHCGTGELVWANAGHMPPLLLGTSGNVSPLPTKKEMVAGAFEDVTYTRFSHQLQPGEGVLLYTDGITEALGKNGVRWNEEGLFNGLKRCRNLSSEALNLALMEEVRTFAGEEPQSDDMTLLNFFWYGSSEAHSKNM